jgi:hypothetical protein
MLTLLAISVIEGQKVIQRYDITVMRTHYMTVGFFRLAFVYSFCMTYYYRLL